MCMVGRTPSSARDPLVALLGLIVSFTGGIREVRGKKGGRQSVGEADDTSIADAARRLATFGKRHGLSLAPMTLKDLLRESRP